MVKNPKKLEQDENSKQMRKIQDRLYHTQLYRHSKYIQFKTCPFGNKWVIY